MLKSILPFLLFCFFFFTMQAQGELGLQLTPGLLQSTKINPALIPDQKLVISLPGVFGNYFHTAGSVGEILDVDTDSTATLNASKFLNNLETDNTLRVHQELETFHINYSINDRVAISLHHAAKSSNYLFYPETLPRLFLQGNAQYIGEEVSFGPDQHTFAYNEIGLGTAISFGKLTVGAKAKLLLGIGDISTSLTEASLYTDPDIYQLTLNSNYRINTSTFSEVLLFDTLSGYDVEYGFREILRAENFQTTNRGYAFDLGLHYEINDQLTVGLSVLDIGKINWRKNVVNYTSDGTFSFSGLDLKGALTGDSISLATAVDTVESILDFVNTMDQYETKMPRKIYANAQYQCSDKLTLAATYYNEYYRGRHFHAFGLGGHYRINKNFSAGLSYNIRNETYFNIGINFIAQKGPFQFFFSTDNVAVVAQPYNNRNINARVGLNLILDQFMKQKEL